MWYRLGGEGGGWDRGIGESVMESLAASKNIWDLEERVWNWGGFVWVYFVCYRGVLWGARGGKCEEKSIWMLGKKQGKTM